MWKLRVICNQTQIESKFLGRNCHTFLIKSTKIYKYQHCEALSKPQEKLLILSIFPKILSILSIFGQCAFVLTGNGVFDKKFGTHWNVTDNQTTSSTKFLWAFVVGRSFICGFFWKSWDSVGQKVGYKPTRGWERVEFVGVIPTMCGL